MNWVIGRPAELVACGGWREWVPLVFPKGDSPGGRGYRFVLCVSPTVT